ncbi:MAG TPA: cytochrome c biogenesis heme-transporting ATPase CcmA [Thiobacillaceae bacterium]|nr:cytochrome c biogenesis heme-transporting ATPase CcmA [Thiobacillaceae bacterium]
MLEAHNLQCSRGGHRLFSGKSFKLDPGTLAWIRGRNGSGKTTLLRTISGLSPVDEGEVRWRGRNIRKHADEFRRELMFMGHAVALKEDLSPLENLRILMQIAGRAISAPAALSALAAVGLKGREHLPVKYLSQGQKRRVHMARLRLSRDCPLWLLDEPLTALDAEGVAALQGLLEEYLRKSGIVVMTSHQEINIESVQSLHVQLPA